MQLFCQKDPRWAMKYIGSSVLMIGGFGCALDCVAMLSTAWNEANGVTPDWIASHADWFTDASYKYGAGLIKWESLVIHGLEYDGRLRIFSNAAVLSAVLNPVRAALIEVAIDGNKTRTHWVIAIRYVPLRGWRVADPLTGTYRWLPKNWKPIGCAFFSKT